jgi:hypothetical protein
MQKFLVALFLLSVPVSISALAHSGTDPASRSDEDYLEAEGSLLSAIDWAKRQSATLFELKAATNLAQLTLKQGRVPEAYKRLSTALDRMPTGIVSPDHTRVLQILSRLQSRSLLRSTT